MTYSVRPSGKPAESLLRWKAGELPPTHRRQSRVYLTAYVSCSLHQAAARKDGAPEPMEKEIPVQGPDNERSGPTSPRGTTAASL